MQPISSQWSFTLGGRIEQDRTEIKPQGTYARHQQWRQFSPKASLQYQWMPKQNIYLSYSKGVRAGGFNPFLPSAHYPVYSPEKVHSYETGIKGDLKTLNLKYAVAAYYMQIDDMQVQQYIGPGVTSITNAATASSSGVETSFDYWINKQWSIDGSLDVNRTRFKHYQDGHNNYDGNKNPYAPDITWHIGLRYDADSWYANASVDGVGSVYLDPANQYRRNSYQLLNISASYPVNQHLTLSTYAKNITNKHYDAVGFMNGSVTVYSPPPELGVKVSYEY